MGDVINADTGDEGVVTSLLGDNPAEGDVAAPGTGDEPALVAKLDDDGNEVLGDDGKPVMEPAPAEEYTDFTLPDGMEVDGEFLGLGSNVFKEIGLTQDQAQKVVDLYSGQLAQQATDWQEQVKTWQNESRADSEYGGKSFNANIGVAGKAIGQFASDGFKKLMEETGIGNHPEMIRFAYNVGKQLTEDNPGQSGNAPGEELSTAELLYGQP